MAKYCFGLHLKLLKSTDVNKSFYLYNFDKFASIVFYKKIVEICELETPVKAFENTCRKNLIQAIKTTLPELDFTHF